MNGMLFNRFQKQAFARKPSDETFKRQNFVWKAKIDFGSYPLRSDNFKTNTIAEVGGNEHLFRSTEQVPSPSDAAAKRTAAAAVSFWAAQMTKLDTATQSVRPVFYIGDAVS